MFISCAKHNSGMSLQTGRTLGLQTNGGEWWRMRDEISPLHHFNNTLAALVFSRNPLPASSLPARAGPPRNGLQNAHRKGISPEESFGRKGVRQHWIAGQPLSWRTTWCESQLKNRRNASYGG
jgi:hypothetical protein